MQEKMIKDTKYLSVVLNEETDSFSVLNKLTGEKIQLQHNIRFEP